MSAPWKLKVFVAQRGTSKALSFTSFPFYFCGSVYRKLALVFIFNTIEEFWRYIILKILNTQDINAQDVNIY